MDEYLTIQEVSDILKVPDGQVYNLAASGLVCAFKVGRHWRIPKGGLQSWIDRQIKINK